MAQAMILGGHTHTRISSYGNPDIRKKIPDMEAQMESLMRAFMLGMNTFPKGGPWIHEAGKMMVEYIWGDKTVEETLKRVEDSWYSHNGEAVGKAVWLTYHEQHGLKPPDWRPSQAKIDKAKALLK
jgi:hypothetical protein